MSSVRRYVRSVLGPLRDGVAAGVATVRDAGHGGTDTLPAVRLGDRCVVPVTADAAVESRVFVAQAGVLYPTPLADWAVREQVEFLPEAPGAYEVLLQLRDGRGDITWFRHRFRVVAPVRDAGPRMVSANGCRLWVPSDWEARVVRSHEPAVKSRLQRAVKPGAVVYDVGANIGLYSVQLGRLAGAAGHVYAIEANPVCLYFLQLNLTLNRLPAFDILPVAVAEAACTVDFVINYRNLMVGAGTHASHLKPGHRIGVSGAALDDLVDDYGLRPPDFIKIDIEGAEGHAISGMRRIVAAHAPTLLIEMHGRTAARQALTAIPWDRYRFEECSSGRVFEQATALADWFPDAGLQVLAIPV